MRNILGPELGARLKPIWGLDPEGEIKGAWRDIGVPRAWCMMGKRICFLSYLIPRGWESVACQNFLTYPLPGRELCVVPVPLDAHRAA